MAMFVDVRDIDMSDINIRHVHGIFDIYWKYQHDPTMVESVDSKTFMISLSIPNGCVV